MSKWPRFAAMELLRFAGLVVLIALVASLMAKMVQGGTTAEFFRQLHLDRDGVPIWGQFVYACKASLPILALSACLLAATAVAVGALSEVPGLGWMRIFSLAVSAIPSFLLPFLPFLLLPSRQFMGLADGGVLAPAACLAIGDCNLSTVASQFRESLRFQRAQPHVQTLEALGRPAWHEVWPRASVTLLASLVGRTPHLIGGLVVLERIFNINGIGNAAFEAVIVNPADLHWLLWICVLCVCIRTLLRLVDLFFQSWWMPDTLQESSTDEQGEDDSTEYDEYAFMAGAHPSSAVSGPDDWKADLDKWLPLPAATVTSIGFWQRLRLNLRYYVRVRRDHFIKVAVSILIVALFLSLLLGCWLYGDRGPGMSFADPGSEHWFGTDLAGIDVVSSIRQGIGQMIIPSLAAMLAGMIAIPASLLGLHRWFPAGILRRIGKWSDAICVYAAEFVESLPKLLVLLAAFSLLSEGVVTGNWFGVTISVNTMVVRLFVVIGLLHAPQVYRAVRDEMQALNHSVYVEAAQMARLRWYQMLWVTILRNHCLHVLLIQAAVIAAGVLHYDAVLGYLGVRGRGVIFTWGSTLGTSVEAYMKYGPLEWFNSWLLAIPFLTVWLGILSFWVMAEAIKIMWGGYVYRLR